MEKVVITTPTPHLLAQLIDIFASSEGEHVHEETLNETEELVAETLQELRREQAWGKKLKEGAILRKVQTVRAIFTAPLTTPPMKQWR